MKEFRSLLMSLLLIIMLAGCNLPTGKPFQNPVTPSMQPSSTPLPLPLSMEMLMNAEYQGKNGTILVKMIDGKYETGSGIDYVSVSMLDQEVAFGDLNSDNAQDAAIILAENYGGSGVFKYLVPVLNHSGAPLPSSGYFLGDRVIVNSLNIADGRIILDMLVHGPNDPSCCPNQPNTQSFKFYWGSGLVQVRVSSKTPTGDLRELLIETPGEGDEVTSKIQLTGNVSISPFENTLLVRILDVNNNQIYLGPIMVSAPDMGAPGTFDTLVDISGSQPSPGMIRIEILDTSMADGSTLAMDSVDVILK